MQPAQGIAPPLQTDRAETISGNTDREARPGDGRDREADAGSRRLPHETLVARIEAVHLRVGIIGLGYVGLPLAPAFCDGGIARHATLIVDTRNATRGVAEPRATIVRA